MSEQIPHDADAEQAILGSILINPELRPEVTLQTDEFYIHRNRWIYDAMMELKVLDILTLSAELKKRKQLDEVGGMGYLTSLVTACENTYNLPGYIEIVKDMASRRRDIEIARMIHIGAHNGGVDRAKAIDMLTRNESVERGAVRIGEGLRVFTEEVEERAKNPRDVWGISTGLPDLDNLTGGLHKQQTSMLVGAPGVGKTTLMLQIALKAALAGHPVAIYELEMDQENLIKRLMTMLMNVPSRAMATGRMDDQWDKFYKGVETLDNLKLFINDNPVNNSMSIRADVSRMKSRHDIEFVALDYLNLLTDDDGGDRNENTTAKAIRFRQTCREFDVAGLSIQSMTKDGMKSLIPQLADMSGPAEVAYSADNVFFMVRPDIDKPLFYTLLPAKQRYGDKGSKTIDLMQPPGKLGFVCVTDKEK